jgi:hypothetical protein
MIPDKDGENAVMKLLAYASKKLEGIEVGSIDDQSISEALEPLRTSLAELSNRMTSNINCLPIVQLFCKKTKHGKTAYDFATHPKIKKEFRKLIQSKLDTAFGEVSDNTSSTRRSNLRAMKLLIKTYKDILDSDTTDEDEQSHLLQRVFIEGAARGCIPAVGLLLKNKVVEIDHQFEIAPNKSGPTALIAAAVGGHLDMVKLLCYKKANIFLTGALSGEEDSKTALVYVREKLKAGDESYRSLEKCLVSHGTRGSQGEKAVELMEKNAELEKRVRELSGAKTELEEKLRLSIELQEVVRHGQ